MLSRQPNVAPCPVCAAPDGPKGGWLRENGHPVEGTVATDKWQPCPWCHGSLVVHADTKLPLDDGAPNN